jgi:hypothetical protein
MMLMMQQSRLLGFQAAAELPDLGATAGSRNSRLTVSSY